MHSCRPANLVAVAPRARPRRHRHAPAAPPPRYRYHASHRIAPRADSHRSRTSMSGMRAWIIVKILGLSIVQQPTAHPGAPRLGWPGGCPTAPPMACPRHVAPPHPAALAHVSRGASRFSGAGPARGGAHVGKAVPCSLGGPREAVSGCLREAAGGHDFRRGASNQSPAQHQVSI
jgi:hypothetical protein